MVAAPPNRFFFSFGTGIESKKMNDLFIFPTLFVLNYRSFDFFDLKFDHPSYSKNYVKYHFFLCLALLI